MKFLNNFSKLTAKNIKTLSQKPKVEKTFSPSHDMAEYVNSYWKWEKLLGEQDSSGDIDSYWRKWVGAVIQECL